MTILKGPLKILISWFDKLTMSVYLMNFAIFPLILSLSKDEKRIIRGALKIYHQPGQNKKDLQ
jgi:hypothetical protein